MKLLSTIFFLYAISALGVDIPSLNWQQRSDWINVKTNAPAAVGDGLADDTVALQTALSITNLGKTIYIPAGTYRITQTLAMTNGTGSTIIGHGRDTRIVWAGTNGGTMFFSNGNNYTRYIGLGWDGSGTASVGFDHASKTLFETEIQHVNESYRNFTGYGIRTGNNQVQASAEVLYRNCLFVNCTNGIGILAFNDYDHSIDRCQFEYCGTGIYCNHGNFYARNSHFQYSSVADFRFNPEHGSSIRRCTSVGSYQFAVALGTVSPITIQDCQIANWSSPVSAIVPSGSHGTPTTIFDCVFSGGPVGSYPIHSSQISETIIISQNTPSNTNNLVWLLSGQKLYSIPNGSLAGTLTNANQVFLQQTASLPTTNIDAKMEFGAVGDGIVDDTTAIQSAINAAKEHGNGAIAYLPTGRYKVSQTLSVSGSNYMVGGTGFKCGLIWSGTAGAPFITVSNVQNVTLADFCVGNSDFGAMTHGDDILIGSTDTCRLTLDGIYAYGKYDLTPDKHGIHFDHLSTGSVVVVQAVQGHLRIDGCDDATLLFRTSYEGTATIKGSPSGKSGIAGFLTRLATSTDPAIRVLDNQSVVMSDFYVEQAQQVGIFEGNTNGPVGTITIQSPKVGMNTTVPVLDIIGYAGRIYYGQTQFYSSPTNTIFQSTNSPLLQLLMSGCNWYNTFPVFSLDSISPTLLGNSGYPASPSDSGISDGAVLAMAGAFDDLRRLGQVDINEGPSIYTPPSKIMKANYLRVKNVIIP